MQQATVEVPKTAEAGYDAVRALIYDQVHKFRRKYGGDLDELIGEAHVAFTLGHQALTKKGRGDGYSTEIRRWVWYELFDAMRTRLARKARVTFTSTADQEDIYPEPAGCMFDRETFLRTLTEDAAEVANLVLCPPPELAAVADGKGGTPRNYKSTVRAHLRATGWQTVRINEAFEEISVALV